MAAATVQLKTVSNYSEVKGIHSSLEPIISGTSTKRKRKEAVELKMVGAEVQRFSACSERPNKFLAVRDGRIFRHHELGGFPTQLLSRGGPSSACCYVWISLSTLHQPNEIWK
jgi:hypothetical protein